MSRKKLSEMSDFEKVEFWVNHHVGNAYCAPEGDVGAEMAVNSARLLAEKINGLIANIKLTGPPA